MLAGPHPKVGSLQPFLVALSCQSIGEKINANANIIRQLYSTLYLLLLNSLVICCPLVSSDLTRLVSVSDLSLVLAVLF